MKVSNKATEYVLIKASTNSEWDDCSFAIVNITNNWKEKQAKRLEAIKEFMNDNCFLSLNFYDSSVTFFKSDENDSPDIGQMLQEEDWAFVDLEENELASFNHPESPLDCYSLVLYRSGHTVFTAYDKYSNDEFRTEELNLNKLCFPDTE